MMMEQTMYACNGVEEGVREGPTTKTTLNLRSERTERAKLAVNNRQKSFPGNNKAEAWRKN